MANRVLTPIGAPITANDNPSQKFQTWITALTNRALIIGNGSPTGVIEAPQGALYMDEDAAAGDILYIKRLDNVGGDRSQGWRAV